MRNECEYFFEQKAAKLAKKMQTTDKTIVHLLWHVRKSEFSEDVKLCGVFSTNEKGEQALAQLSAQPGFCEHLAGFEIATNIMDRVEWTQGFGVDHPLD